MDDRKLIKLVRSFDALYNTGLSQFRCLQTKKDAWRTIAIEMDEPEDVCIKRWASLRERFSRECKRFSSPSGKTDWSECTWYLIKDMLFLKDFVKQRSSLQKKLKEEIMDEKKLIQLIRDHEVLYKKGSRKYKSSETTKNAWKIIADEMDLPEELCLKRWTTMRERFSRECKKMHASAGSEIPFQSTWLHMDDMEFLKDYIRPRVMDTMSVYIEDVDMSPEFCQVNADTVSSFEEASAAESTQHTNSTPYSSPSSSPRSSPVNLPKITNNGEVESELLEAIKQFREFHKKPTGQNAVAQAFGQMITALLTEMSERKQSKAMKVLLEEIIKIKFETEEVEFEY